MSLSLAYLTAWFLYVRRQNFLMAGEKYQVVVDCEEIQQIRTYLDIHENDINSPEDFDDKLEALAMIQNALSTNPHATWAPNYKLFQIIYKIWFVIYRLRFEKINPYFIHYVAFLIYFSTIFALFFFETFGGYKCDKLIKMYLFPISAPLFLIYISKVVYNTYKYAKIFAL